VSHYENVPVNSDYARKYKDDKIRVEFMQQQKLISKIKQSNTNTDFNSNSPTHKPQVKIQEELQLRNNTNNNPIQNISNKINTFSPHSNVSSKLNSSKPRDQRNDDDLLDCILDMKQPSSAYNQQNHQIASKRATSLSNNSNSQHITNSKSAPMNLKPQSATSNQPTAYSQRPLLNKQVSSSVLYFFQKIFSCIFLSFFSLLKKNASTATINIIFLKNKATFNLIRYFNDNNSFNYYYKITFFCDKKSIVFFS